MSNSRTSPPATDPFEDLRGTLWAAMVHAQTGQDYADLRDLEGLHYALRSCDACLQRAVSLYNQAREAVRDEA